MKTFKKVLVGIICLELIVTLGVTYVIKKNRAEEAQRVASLWFNNYSIVAHAFGAIDGFQYTNSLEAFEYNYEQGTRVFEVDLCLTSDNQLVLNHGWKDHRNIRLGIETEDSSPMSYDEFMSQKMFGKYTPLDSKDLINILKEHPDIYIILDWGSDLTWNEELQYDHIFDIDDLISRNKLFIDQVKSVDEELLDRIIPQIYYEEHFNQLDKIYPFDNYIYTLYKNYQNTTPKQIMSFVEKNDIDVICSNMIGEQAITTKEVLRQIKLDRTKIAGMGVYIHTINSEEDYKKYINEGYKGIYTDNLTENGVKDVQKD